LNSKSPDGVIVAAEGADVDLVLRWCGVGVALVWRWCDAGVTLV